MNMNLSLTILAPRHADISRVEERKFNRENMKTSFLSFILKYGKRKKKERATPFRNIGPFKGHI